MNILYCFPAVERILEEYFMRERGEIMKKYFCVILPIVALMMVCNWSVFADQQEAFFSKSLHYTGEGMRYWYEAEDGFMSLTGVPYDKLACKQCHSTGCNDCHLTETNEGPGYSLEMAKKDETCFKCHSRGSAVAKLDEERNIKDVHTEADMVCSDCHTAREVHGDGNFYHTMRNPKVKDAKCSNCHTKDSKDYPAVPKTRSHVVHRDKLDCNACHVQNTMTCYNCHFGEFAKTKSKPKSFVSKVKDFLLLVKYKGKITSGTLQSLVSAEDKPFIVYAPHLTHSIMNEGRKCEDCHGTEAVKTIASGKRHKMAEIKDGKASFYKGIVPLAPDLLDWPFFRKEDGKWVPFEPDQKPLVQMGLHAEPFSQKDLDKLKREHKYKEQK